jgi:hypothetical protein
MLSRAPAGGTVTTVALLCGLLSAGCQPAASAGPGPGVGGAGGKGGSGSGGGGQSAGDSGGAGSGGLAPGDAASSSQPDSRVADSSGTGGTGNVPDAATADVTAAETATPTPNPGQGPVAEGRIVFSQDFENGTDGITRSPTDLPADRAQVADDPLGQRGKVMKILYRAGDNFMTNGGSTHTRSWISNTGYSFPLGSTVHIAWGFMTTSVQIDAAIAQTIRPGGPMWFIEGNGDGTIYVNCRSCGGKGNLPVRMEPNKWYDIRVEMEYRNGGALTFIINGQKVLERRMNVSDPPSQRAHWDGGLYNHAAGTYTRTVYVSNLSIGLK